MIKAPAPPADSPPWGVAMLRDVIAWVRAISKEPAYLPSYTVSTLPSAADWYTSQNSSMIFVSNESGGAVAAFTDGANWRRVTDRAIVS